MENALTIGKLPDHGRLEGTVKTTRPVDRPEHLIRVEQAQSNPRAPVIGKIMLLDVRCTAHQGPSFGRPVKTFPIAAPHIAGFQPAMMNIPFSVKEMEILGARRLRTQGQSR